MEELIESTGLCLNFPSTQPPGIPCYVTLRFPGVPISGSLSITFGLSLLSYLPLALVLWSPYLSYFSLLSLFCCYCCYYSKKSGSGVYLAISLSIFFHFPFLLSQIGWVLRVWFRHYCFFPSCYLGCLYYYYADSLGIESTNLVVRVGRFMGCNIGC